MIQKLRRIEDRKLLDSYHRMRCIVCNGLGSTVGHHIKSKGSGGDDVESNLMPLCARHHHEIHSIGLTEFSEKYNSVVHWLVAHSWEFDGRWRHYE